MTAFCTTTRNGNQKKKTTGRGVSAGARCMGTVNITVSGIATYLLLLLHEILQLLLTGRQGKREGRGRRKKKKEARRESEYGHHVTDR